ncbi:hypothetical protein ACJJJB_04335 [Microbulbifer sp. ANSA001]|uniref:hypothetical protein n=1 Tax=Microbulbifer sp. ANSA001 TaxID=3243358 RepID=UPI0040432D2C
MAITPTPNKAKPFTPKIDSLSSKKESAVITRRIKNSIGASDTPLFLRSSFDQKKVTDIGIIKFHNNFNANKAAQT